MWISCYKDTWTQYHIILYK